MPEPRVDPDLKESGTVRWLLDCRPYTHPVNYTGDCLHVTVRCVAWGPTERNYELLECLDCEARSWASMEQLAGGVTPWMVPSESA